MVAGPATYQVAVQAQTWSDGSLGCPQSGHAYTMALVRGWRVQVTAAGQERIYHASQAGQWLLCPAGQAPAPGPAGPATR